MEFKELIKARRSVRGYAEGSAPSDDELRQMIADAQLAPTWKNSQTARYYVANTPEKIEAVRKALPEFNQNSSENAALVVTTYVKNTSGFEASGDPTNELGNKWGAYDLGLANAYFVLAAKEIGYDTLIMGIRDAATLREIWNIPKNEQITAVIAVGKAKREAVLGARKALDEIATF